MKDQHFMTDTSIIRKIIKKVNAKPNEKILEIGPGNGELTKFLAEKAKVIAVEKDKILAEKLRKRFRKVKIIHGNGLKEVDKHGADKIVSNLPYSICESLFKKLPYLNFKQGFFTIPRKFSERLFSVPYSYLLETEIVFDIPKNSFTPKPRTNSVFVIVNPIKQRDILGETLIRKKNKVKNAIMEAIITVKGKTKREAKEDLNVFDIKSLMDKRVFDLNLKELEKLEIAFSKVKTKL